jgi:hypothetical protein
MSAAGSSIPRGTWLTLSPSVPGVTFNPSSLSVAWYEDIQEAGFRFRAELEAANKSAFGWVNVCAGAVPIAQGKPAAPAAAESAPAPTLPVVASVVPLLPAASLGVVAQIRRDVGEAVSFLEEITGLRWIWCCRNRLLSPITY